MSISSNVSNRSKVKSLNNHPPLTIVMLALGMLSGGLDSSLAVKLIKDQGIQVVAVKFTSPFCQCDSGGRCHAAHLAQELGIRFINVPKGEDYLEVVREPKHGRGSGMNPCIDCRIFMLRTAKEMMEQLGAQFIFTGEVLGQRPMSQHMDAMRIIEREAGLEGRLLRPLSAKLLPETEAERMGWIDRSKLLDIQGRSRKRQIGLADEIGLHDYPCPAGGCLLTSKEFSIKLADHLEHRPAKLTMKDIAVLKVGRHFRIMGQKTVVGRNQKENETLRGHSGSFAYLLEPVSTVGPVCLTEAEDDVLLDRIASIVARYSDHNGGPVQVRMSNPIAGERTVDCMPAVEETIRGYRIGPEAEQIRIT
jgi:tRNA-uridine 2-sulfurtransferase